MSAEAGTPLQPTSAKLRFHFSMSQFPASTEYDRWIERKYDVNAHSPVTINQFKYVTVSRIYPQFNYAVRRSSVVEEYVVELGLSREWRCNKCYEHSFLRLHSDLVEWGVINAVLWNAGQCQLKLGSVSWSVLPGIAGFLNPPKFRSQWRRSVEKSYDVVMTAICLRVKPSCTW